jgi:hypothetical protein
LPCLYLWFLSARYLQKDSVGFVATSAHSTAIAQPLAPRIEQLAQPQLETNRWVFEAFWTSSSSHTHAWMYLSGRLPSWKVVSAAGELIQKSLKSKERDRDVFQHLHIIMKNQFGNMYS